MNDVILVEFVCESDNLQCDVYGFHLSKLASFIFNIIFSRRLLP